jgi:N-acetylglucosaminyl-diphospho-decaprenol L-rhamnosyltransferase
MATHARESGPPAVDVVVVTFNSGRHVGSALAPLLGVPWVRVTVVDNASADDSVEVVRALGVMCLAERENLGFAVASNIGWRSGTGDYVLFLNPDARIEVEDVGRLKRVLDVRPDVDIAAPRFFNSDGTPAFYLRRFPQIRSTYARALFLHRILARAASDEVIRDPAAYERSGPQDWVPAACLLVRRRLLEELDGFDEGFFMYCEDKDLCKRARDAGSLVWYEASATCVHEGQASTPGASLVPVLAASRLRYLEKHVGPATAMTHRLGLALEALTRVAVVRGGMQSRAAHARALAAIAGSSRYGGKPASVARTEAGATRPC